MNEERFIEIMEENFHFAFIEDDPAVLGLLLIRKYIPKAGIEGTNHEMIVSASVERLVKAGITEEDAKNLRNLNWMITDGHLACFV